MSAVEGNRDGEKKVGLDELKLKKQNERENARER